MADYFKGKVVLITGGSSGIGKALVDEALKRGARVATCGRSLEKLQAAFPGADPGRLLLAAADVRDEAACTAFVHEALAAWGRVDVLINNAGITMRALFDDASLAVIRNLMDINFWGTVQCTKAALPHIKKSKGVIVGISSIAGYRGLPARTGYSASKFAMQGFLEALRTELLHTGVHVMWVSPGFTASNIRNVALAADGSAQGETPLDEAGLMSAAQCAQIILQAIAARKRTVIMTGQGKLTVWLNKLLPGLADKLVFRHFAKEPGSPLK
jgi:NADP-dependent 3-hydroxy acid dehydrogenase YdfG